MPIAYVPHPVRQEALRRIALLRRTAEKPNTRETGSSFAGLRAIFVGTVLWCFEHILVAGPTGMGKTEIVFRMFFDAWICQDDAPAIVLFDAHGRFAEKAAAKCEEYGLFGKGLAHFDRLRDVKHGLGYGWTEPSRAADPEQRQAETREKITVLKSVLVRTEEMLDTTKTVMIDEVMDDVLSLALDRDNAIPFYFLLYAFEFDSDTFQYLYATCMNEWTKRKFREYQKLSRTDFQYKCVPVRRRIEKFCHCIQARKRSVATFDFEEFMNKGGKLLLSGESKGDLGRDDMSRILGLLIVLLISIARIGRLRRRVIVIIDEGVAAKLIDLNIARALDEARKWGITFVLITQHPLSLPDEVRDSVFTNCKTKFVFLQPDPDDALYFARMLAIPRLGLHVKYSDIRMRRVTSGYEKIATSGRSIAKDLLGRRKITESEGEHFLPVQEDVREQHDTYYTFDELVAKRQQELMNLDIGDFERISTGYVSTSPEHFDLLESKWTGLTHPGPPAMPFSQYKLEQALLKLHQKPEYQLRLVDLPTWEKPKDNKTTRTVTPMRRNATKPSNGSSQSTRQRPSNSSNSGSSVAPPKRANGSASSNGKNGPNGSAK
jgi:hypothetical protein